MPPATLCLICGALQQQGSHWNDSRAYCAAASCRPLPPVRRYTLCIGAAVVLRATVMLAWRSDDQAAQASLAKLSYHSYIS